jgi:isoquinoline 1-oxidoreductase beta subunit
MNEPANLDRRTFLKSSAALAGSLVIGFHLSMKGARAAAQSRDAATGEAFAPNAFLRIAPDNTVTVIVKHLEMGQGVYTGLPTLVAEELEVDWSQVRVETAPADVTRYANLAWGGAVQGTGGSTSLANSWEQLRRAGATAREMLIAAAARTWNVNPQGLKAEKGFVIDPRGGRRFSYGELAAKAASLSPPADVKLKAPSQWKLIGQPVPRKDSPEKVNGSALFSVDVKLPGMLTAVVARPPRFGSKVKRFDAEKAKAMPGVKAVVEIPQGVAVVATDFWSAVQGRNALVIEWDEAQAFTGGSEALTRRYVELARQTGAVARKEGDAEGALGSAARRLSATFEFPFLAHAPMEPLSCVVRLSGEACEVWAGSQLQTLDQAIAARIAGLPPERVQIHTLLAGGSFGRHANPTADYIAEGVAVAAATRPLGAPIRLLGTREDDIRGGYYRPLYVHRIAAGLDAAGRPVAWQQRIVGQSILKGTPFEGMMKEGIDPTSVEGAANLPYAIPHLQVELHTVDIGVPVLWWRSVGSTHTAFSTEVMMDMLAHAAGEDPVAFRLQLLDKHPRHAGVLKLAAEKAGWARPLPKNRGRGVAVHESFHSFVAQVVEVTVKDEGIFSVDRVVCAVDCGVAVNPDLVRAQMESGIVFGLSAALHGAIILRDGIVVQSNFNDYPVLRLDETPRIEVHIVKSEAPPTGVGEPGVPPVAPALANALFAATGKRLTKLPLRLKEA